MKNRHIQVFSAKKQLIFLSFLVFFTNSTYLFSQAKTNNSTMVTEKGKFDKIVEIKMNTSMQFGDSLTVVLDGFSHKETTNGKGSKGMSHLQVTKGDVSEEVILSEYGSSSNPGMYSYDTQLWNGYSIELKKLNYNASIEVVISKAK
jgi:hypothetical protein